ncbi:MAG: type IV secretion system DNA-binding domain-containing protein [Gammaproteobacteria bacterium]|nr:type IV secretion system DNA-binding domain-containing protein [Gammaproteobacteria bacterium]
MIHKLIDHFYDLEWGGTLDTLALLLLYSGLIRFMYLIFSGYGEWFQWLMVGTFLTMAFIWLSWRILQPLFSEASIPSHCLLELDLPPTVKTEPKILLGYCCLSGRPLHLTKDEIMRHILMVGQSGVGKTNLAFLMFDQQIQNRGGMIFIDGKIDYQNIEKLWNLAEKYERGKDFFILQPDDPSISHTYNPILFGDADEKADALMLLIPDTEQNAGADYYKQEAKQALTCILQALQAAKIAYHLMDLAILLSVPKALLDLEQQLAFCQPNGRELKELQFFMDKFSVTGSHRIDVKKLREVLGGISGRLFSLGSGHFGQIMNVYEPQVKLLELVLQNKILYVALPTMGKDTSAKNFASLFIADLRTVIANLQKKLPEDRPNPPFLVFCDEAGSYVNASWGRIPEQARSAHIAFVPAVQTNANFQAVSHELHQMIVGNSWVKIFFKLGNQETALEIAELIGKSKRVKRAKTILQTMGKSKPMVGPLPQVQWANGHSLSWVESEDEQYTVSPDDLKKLPPGECLVLVGGEKLYHLKVPFLDDLSLGLDKGKLHEYIKQGIPSPLSEEWQPAHYFAELNTYIYQ